MDGRWSTPNVEPRVTTSVLLTCRTDVRACDSCKWSSSVQKKKSIFTAMESFITINKAPTRIKICYQNLEWNKKELKKPIPVINSLYPFGLEWGLLTCFRKPLLSQDTYHILPSWNKQHKDFLSFFNKKNLNFFNNHLDNISYKINMKTKTTTQFSF